ncbi:MAG TPA: glycosyltransferase [Solirubrobacteraceae bacterium]|nr:glycosyltransferase [Solirubrobacteraceae bacterium]
MAELLLVSLGSTVGLRASDAELAASLRRCGADVAVVAAATPRQVRTLALTDLAWARAARVAAFAGIAREQPRAIIYSTITAALLAPTPGAIRLDALSAQNRPGRHGIWQRPRERTVLARAPLLLPVSEAALTGAPARHAPAIVVPIVVGPSGPLLPREQRDIAAITYAANPDKKGLDRVLEAWAAARREGEELVLTGIDDAPRAEGVRLAGTLEREEYRALLRRSRLYLAAPRREEYGIAQLEALADGAMLVSSETAVPYAALGLAREADPRLVGPDLAGAIRTALDDPRPDYAAAVAPLLERFSAASVDRVIAEQVLPALLGER